MEADRVARRFTTPMTAPAYSPGRYRFIDREYMNIVYRTDPDALRAVVPEPLQIDEPLVRFEIMHMGDVGGYGPYTEGGQAIPVRFGDEKGEYLHAMYLDNFPATAAGRELSAYPKTIGAPRLRVEEGALIGTLDVTSERVATATMGYKHRELDLDEARSQITVPTFMLKVVRGHDVEPVMCDLVRTEITDVEVKGAWTGPARLQLFEHVLAPLADLPVLEVVDVSHIMTDLTLAGVEKVHDYLADA
ncbi:acetoacetate decarboxylase [Ilumatobacter sp.]|uniref:acetoacetate decarboxylase n=1 Tax=Ilumatobacter sp. TaxID=1967498 RepID=UPI003B52F79A